MRVMPVRNGEMFDQGFQQEPVHPGVVFVQRGLQHQLHVFLERAMLDGMVCAIGVVEQAHHHFFGGKMHAEFFLQLVEVEELVQFVLSPEVGMLQLENRLDDRPVLSVDLGDAQIVLFLPAGIAYDCVSGGGLIPLNAQCGAAHAGSSR